MINLITMSFSWFFFFFLLIFFFSPPPSSFYFFPSSWLIRFFFYNLSIFFHMKLILAELIHDFCRYCLKSPETARTPQNLFRGGTRGYTIPVCMLEWYFPAIQAGTERNSYFGLIVHFTTGVHKSLLHRWQNKAIFRKVNNICPMKSIVRFSSNLI